MRLHILIKLFCLCLLLPVSATADDKAGAAQALANIKAEDFAAGRKVYEKRPKPPGLDFDAKAVEKYISTLPQELRDVEKTRFDKIKEIKGNIIKTLERNPYDSKDGVKIREGKDAKTVSGTIALANEEIVIVKKGKKSKRYKWDELAFEQYELFLTYYADQRLKKTAANVKKEDSIKYAAEDFFRLALLCDWFGEYESSLKYAKKSIELNSEMKEPVQSILLR